MTSATRYATDYTVDELVVAAIAHSIRDGELVQQGGGTALGIVAVLLARLTHAPNLKYNYLASVDPQFDSLGDPGHSALAVAGTSLMPFTIDQMVSMCLRGKTDVFGTMPAQIDRYGNVNVSLIGEHQRPDVRFPGGYGITDWFLYAGRVFAYVPRHTTRSFVEQVDYVTGTGHLPGGLQERQRLGIPGRGPERVFSNLAVMSFDDESGLMRLESLHPGVTLAEVEANTGFDLPAAEDVGETQPPTEEEIALIRDHIDPRGLRRHRF